jgi:hypothetical protein
MPSEKKSNSATRETLERGEAIMTRKYRLLKLGALLAMALSVALAVPAFADSVTTEQQQGGQILAQVHRGKLSPKSLTNDQYQNVGEYLMGQALGSTPVHQRRNTLMDEMMGAGASGQMHIYLGKRYLGIDATAGARYGALYGLMSAMMSGYRGSALAGMMSAYLNGQGKAGYSAGPGMMGYSYAYTPTTKSSDGWPTGAVIAVAILGTLLAAGALAFATPRFKGRSRRPTPNEG